MSLGGVLLGLLERGPAHGYDLKARHDAHLSARRLALPQVYATLSRLERDGLIVKDAVVRGGGPERTVYRVTDDGIARLDDWLASAEVPTPYVQSIVFAKVVVAVITGRDADELLRRQLAAHRAEMRALTARKEKADLPETLALDLALFHLEADVRWIAHTTARLEDLRRELA